MSITKDHPHGLYTILPYGNYFLFYRQARYARLFYKHYSLDLIRGERVEEGIHFFKRKLSAHDQQDHLVIHAFFELGYLFTHGPEELDDKAELALIIEYDDMKKVGELRAKEVTEVTSWQSVDEKTYANSFERGRQYLKRGDCYQYNLTFPFRTKIQSSGFAVASSLWKERQNRGAFAHFTYSDYLQRSFLSNSPECLFQVKNNTLYSVPIKGTIACLDHEVRSKKKQLDRSLKNESELFMITDLIKNDLNWLTYFKAQVVAKKWFLKVPGLLHSFSVLKAPLKDQTLWDILTYLFPGGSITGAPKRRVMEIIRDLESYRRGFYCGSTIVKSKDLLAASINIRSCSIDEKSGLLTYCAGGGITFDSDGHDEYQEMLLKHGSFADLIH